MELTVYPEILRAYGFEPELISLQLLGAGHINSTYLISDQNEEKYILQQLNTKVFKEPYAIANNIDLIVQFLRKYYPSYLFPSPVATLKGELMAQYHNEFWRLLPFIPNCIAPQVLTDPAQAYEAAKQFGQLSRLLDPFDTALLKPTISGFHDLTWRYEQFDFALNQAGEELKSQAAHEIELAKHHQFLLAYYASYAQSADFPDRVMHHDTKISNVLLAQESHKGVCVIDLDTLMPGKFISDLGDMIRTYICAFPEDETSLDQIKIRLPYFRATISGYLSEMAAILTATEKELLLFSGKYMVYMQALRFLTDFLNGSIYYPIAYPLQNLDRAKNQFRLLAELFENEKILQGIIDECLAGH